MAACRGNTTVHDAASLVAAVTDGSPGAPCRVLLASSEYALADALTISRSVQVISVLAADRAVLRAVPAGRHRVLNVSAGDVVLDGVVIADGGAVADYPDDAGGGMYITGGNVTLLHSIVANNTGYVRRPPPLAPAIATRRDASRCAEAHERVFACVCVAVCVWCGCHRRRMVVGLTTTTAT